MRARRHSDRLGRRLALVLAAAVVTLVAGAAPAYAHDTLIASDPSDGAELSAVPNRVSLTFSASPLTAGAFLSAVGPDGAPIELGPPTFDGPRVSSTWPRTAASAGVYQLVWRVVSSDGHPIEGTLSFSLDGSAASPTSTSSAPTSSASTPAESTAAASSSPSDVATPTGSWFLPIAIGAGAAVLLAIVVTRRRAVSRADDDEAEPVS